MCHPEGGMIPNFLVPETVAREDGTGPELELGPTAGRPLLLTLGINRIIEQESLDVSIWGSPDRQNWGSKPIVSFPQKFYCGTYQIVVDLSEHADLQFLRAQWKVSRWGRGEPKPLFGFYVFAQELAAASLAAKTA